MCFLTDKQKAIVRFIHSFQYDFNMAPTVYEIGNHFGLKIPSVFAHLESLIKKRIIVKDSKARSIHLIGNNKFVQSLKIPSQHYPALYSIPVIKNPICKRINNINDSYNTKTHCLFDSHIYHRLIGEYGVYALFIDQYNQYLSTVLDDGDLLLVNPDTSFITQNSIILASVAEKLSIFRCIQWRYGLYSMIPWGEEETESNCFSGEQIDLNVFGVVIGLQRSFFCHFEMEDDEGAVAPETWTT